MSQSDANLLDRIVATKEREIAALPSEHQPHPENPRDFVASLRRAPGAPIRVIAECKKASPSSGLMRPIYEPEQIARTYADLGAAAISVLTDLDFFQGSIEHLQSARKAGIPVLRKDFTLSKKQIAESRSIGADAILLIVRLLTPALLSELRAFATSLGLATLVEIHDESELQPALDSGAEIIGINHRNLDTLSMDLSLTENLAPRIRRARPECVIVAESGVESPEGRARVDSHADAILIGTAFMKSGDIRHTWREIFS